MPDSTREKATVSPSFTVAMITDDIQQSLAGNFRGGTEKQNRLLAETLKNHGHSITFIDLTHQKDPIEINGFTICSTWESDRGIPVLRYIYYRLPQLVARIRELNPDVVYLRGAGGFLGLAALICRYYGIPFIWGLGNDWCLDTVLRRERFRSYHSWLTRMSKEIFTRLGIFCMKRFSSAVVCQTRSQQSKLGTISPSVHVISNICDRISGNSSTDTDAGSVVWIGKLSGHKGESALADLAGMLPDLKIHVFGEIRSIFRETAVFSRLDSAPNVQIEGKQPHATVMTALGTACVCLSTSPTEGFSNTFLEAWAYGVPVVALHVDPDGLIEEKGLGYTTHGDIREMADRVREITTSPEKRREIGLCAAKYVSDNHGSEIIGNQFQSLMAKVSSHGTS